jgi:serine phosphatase RsbU (regulator of sigma subunit)
MENAQLYNEMKELNEELRQEIEDRKKSEEERIRIKAESRRKTEELEEARRYQLSMLPDSPPEIEGLDISTYLKTASEVGGDYYDFLSKGSNTLLTVTGDATGHGMSAGLMVAMTKSALNAINNDTPANILHYLNKVILNVKTNRLHMALNLVEFKDDSVLISSAAMPPIYLFKNETQELEEILLPGPPIGCMKNVEYDELECSFTSGDSLVMMSDGLPESYNHRNEQMGYELIEERIRKVAHQSSEGIKNELVQLNREWAGEVDNIDDITIIVIKRV